MTHQFRLVRAVNMSCHLLIHNVSSISCHNIERFQNISFVCLTKRLFNFNLAMYTKCNYTLRRFCFRSLVSVKYNINWSSVIAIWFLNRVSGHTIQAIAVSEYRRFRWLVAAIRIAAENRCRICLIHLAIISQVTREKPHWVCLAISMAF